jgi:hypothetical protein
MLSKGILSGRVFVACCRRTWFSASIVVNFSWRLVMKKIHNMKFHKHDRISTNSCYSIRTFALCFSVHLSLNLHPGFYRTIFFWLSLILRASFLFREVLTQKKPPAPVIKSEHVNTSSGATKILG